MTRRRSRNDVLIPRCAQELDGILPRSRARAINENRGVRACRRLFRWIRRRVRESEVSEQGSESRDKVIRDSRSRRQRDGFGDLHGSPKSNFEIAKRNRNRRLLTLAQTLRDWILYCCIPFCFGF